MKFKKKPYSALLPCPVILVTCIDSDRKPTILKLAWAGTVRSDPPTVALDISPKKYSYGLIEVSGEFVAS